MHALPNGYLLKLLSKYTLKNIIKQKYAECFPVTCTQCRWHVALFKKGNMLQRFLIKDWHPHLPGRGKLILYFNFLPFLEIKSKEESYSFVNYLEPLADLPKYIPIK